MRDLLDDICATLAQCTVPRKNQPTRCGAKPTGAQDDARASTGATKQQIAEMAMHHHMIYGFAGNSAPDISAIDVGGGKMDWDKAFFAQSPEEDLLWSEDPGDQPLLSGLPRILTHRSRQILARPAKAPDSDSLKARINVIRKGRKRLSFSLFQ